MFEEEAEIADHAWSYQDTINFAFEIKDTNRIYNLYLEVDHDMDFPFQNLYTQIYTRFPSGERIKEMVSLELADKTGLWIGDCNNNYCSLNIPIQQGAYFNAAGQYQITLEQFMRQDPLPGVRKLSFKIEDTGKTR
ncbi:MAG: hypothetical protein DHS20C18_10310 [Saprospiraceae bacterium]|nr:MAG: hypothetical protein DHS20C18_10310 [Saprospiraceae bacterium]